MFAKTLRHVKNVFVKLESRAGILFVTFAIAMLLLATTTVFIANSLFENYQKNTLSDFPQARLTRFFFKVHAIANASDAACTNAIYTKNASSMERCIESVDSLFSQISGAENHPFQVEGLLKSVDALKAAAAEREKLILEIFPDSESSVSGNSIDDETALKFLLQNTRKFSQIVSDNDSKMWIALGEKKAEYYAQGATLRTILFVTIALSAVITLSLWLLWRKYRVARKVASDAKMETAAAKLKVIHSARLSAVGEMAGSIAHEIATPLTVISLQAQNLVAMANDSPGVTSDELIVACERIERTVERIARTIQSLRKMARASKPTPFEAVPLSKVFAGVLDMSGEKLRKHGIEIKLIFTDDFKFMGREIELSQVVLNLINNSFDAIVDNEEKWISLDAKTVERSRKRFVQIAVTDSGRGIPPHIRAHIMNPFFTTKDADKGTGLGLSISKDIVEAHGGALFIDTECANTRFIVEVPEAIEFEQRTFVAAGSA
jgi:signal transduction histidine kinase